MSKIALLLLGKKGFKVLQDICDSNGLNLLTDVVASRDSGVDNDFYDEIRDFCIFKGVLFHDRLSQSFSTSEYEGYLIAVGWKWMLPSGNKVLVIHDSILPRYRGFAPLVNTLINGELVIGATAVFADVHYDKGKIVAQYSKSICYPIKICEAIELMCNVYIEIARRLIDAISKNEILKGIEQNESLASYSLWRDEHDYWIDWAWDAEKIKRFVDAVGVPYAGARTFCNDVIAIINSVELIEDVQINDRCSAVGKVIFIRDIYPVVVCGQGLIKITDMKTLQGESLMPLKNFRTRFVSNKK
jgi:methionyl-tRNA formyltransferase